MAIVLSDMHVLLSANQPAHCFVTIKTSGNSKDNVLSDMHVLLSAAKNPAASKHGGHPALDAGSRDQEIKSAVSTEATSGLKSLY